MKKSTIILVFAVVLLLLPSCMVNKCRYSSGWKIDIGSGRQSKNEELTEKQANHAKKVLHEPNASTHDSAPTVNTLVTDFDTITKKEHYKSLGIRKAVKKINTPKNTPILSVITNKSTAKSSATHANSQTQATKTHSDDFLDFMGVMVLALLIGFACIAGIVGLVAILLQGTVVLEIIGLIITIILLLAGCNI